MAAETKIDRATVFRKTSHQVSCQINDEVAILDLQRSLYFCLEGVAVELWEALDEPTSVSALCDRIVAAYDVSKDDCEADAVRLLLDLQAEGLVEVVP